jgi:hypothetical protein
MFKILLLCLFSLSVFAKNNYVKGEGHFYAERGDSLAFIKKQLMTQGFKSVITKELESMGFSANEFWEKYEQKFKEEKMTEIKEKLDKRFGIWVDLEAEKNTDASEPVEVKTLTKQQQQDYDKKLRYKLLISKRNYGNIERVIRSFSVKKISRSPQNPQSRYISLEAKVDRVYLSKIYYEFMREQKPKEVAKLFLFPEYHLKNTRWSDLGVKIKSDFTSAVNSSWKKWLEDNKVENIEDVEIVELDDAKAIFAHFNLPEEQLTTQANSKFKDSLVLKVDLWIEKISHHEIFREYEFKFKSEIVLIDLMTNKVLFKSDIPKDEKVYRDINYDNLKNAVANYVYRIPLGKFTSMKKAVSKASKVDSVQRVTIENFKNIDEVFSFIELLKNKGIKLRINPVLKSFDDSKADIIVFYQGGGSTLEKFILGLKNFTGSQSYDFDFYPEQNYRVKLIRKKIRRSKASEEVRLQREFMQQRKRIKR